MVKAARVLCAATLALVFSARAHADSVMHTITVGWNPSPSGEVAGYRLHYGQERGNYTQTIEAGTATTAEIANLIEGTTYYFIVTAYAADGKESYPSEEFHYLPNPAVLLNIATRARVQTGDDVMIAGFIVGGTGQKKMVVRALGPTLNASGLRDTLADPAMEVYGPMGIIATIDNWREGDANALAAVNLVPQYDTEAATVLVLSPGSYSVVVYGSKNTTGMALLEVYDAGAP